MLWRQLVRRQHQPVDPATLLEVGFDDLVDIRLVLVTVPDALGVDHHVGAVLAAVEATGGIEANVLHAELPRFLTRIAAQLVKTAGGLGARHAAAARMALGPHVVAHEDVTLVEQLRIVGHSGSPLLSGGAGKAIRRSVSKVQLSGAGRPYTPLGRFRQQTPAQPLPKESSWPT